WKIAHSSNRRFIGWGTLMAEQSVNAPLFTTPWPNYGSGLERNTGCSVRSIFCWSLSACGLFFESRFGCPPNLTGPYFCPFSCFRLLFWHTIPTILWQMPRLWVWHLPVVTWLISG